MRSLVALLFFSEISLLGCAPPKKDKTNSNQVPGGLPVSEENSENAGSTINDKQPTGRAVDLYAIRASAGKGFVPPALDKLPCPFFRQGSAFSIPAVRGGPPLPLPGPLQNHYSGDWNGLQEFRFKVSAYNRLYSDPGIPNWLLTPPTSRAIEYVTKLFNVTVTNPTQANCTISARALN